MLTAVIYHQTVEQVESSIAECDDAISVIEWRLDALSKIDINIIKTVCELTKKPIILTLRCTRDGGEFSGSEAQRRALLLQLAQCGADFIDIEHHVDTNFIDKVMKTQTKTKMIRSYHNFEKTPANIESIFYELQHAGVSQYKMATTPLSSLDGLRLLQLSKRHRNLSAHCMGEDGVFTRILAAACDTPFLYATLEHNPHLPTVLTVQQWRQYRFSVINNATPFYALVGNPVSHSPGHLFHNAEFEKNNSPAVYLKIKLDKSEFTQFLNMTKIFNLRGLSITIPLKQVAAKHVSADLRAINTLSSNNSRQYANTDGPGAVKAIETATNIKGTHILFLGAGGTACGIINELKQKECKISVLARDVKKAQFSLRLMSVEIYNTPENIENVDIIVGTVPPGAYKKPEYLASIKPLISAHTTVMDVNYYPEITPLLKLALSNNAKIIKGTDMFREQAALQQAFWRDATSGT